MAPIARTTLVLAILFFVALVIASMSAPAERAAATAMETIADGAGVPMSSIDNNLVCPVTTDQAAYGQTSAELTITPLEQHDDSSGSQWTTTWQVLGPPGMTFQAEVVVLHCFGDIANLTYCLYDRAAITTTYTLTVTLPPSGITTFSVVDGVTCCEVAEADLTSVNSAPWGASYFDRKAYSPGCQGQPTSTPVADLTKTGTPTTTATPTVTDTPTSTATATATAVDTATATPSPTATETPTVIPSATSTDTATPTGTATATDTPTATETASPTATWTATATATRTGYYWYFPVVLKDQVTAF